jgi:hypothetical protein
MGMKPRLNDAVINVPGTVSSAKKVDEFGNIPGTVSTLKREKCDPDSGVPGVVIPSPKK